jgi:hypothetical protein
MDKIRQLEVKHELFESVEEMLAPRTLSELVQKPVVDVNVIPLGDNGGLSGSHFSAVETDKGRYFLKHMSREHDFLMMATDDVQCRSVTLWQYGLLDEIRPFLAHKILGCSQDDGGWAILMEDLQEALYSDDRPFTVDHFFEFLDALARLHAAFWDDARLADPALGLMDTASRAAFCSPPVAEHYQHQTQSPLPEWILGGWQVLPDLLPPEAYRQIRDLILEPQPLLSALARYPCTLTHGDYRQANFAYDGEGCVIFDWQVAASTLMTTELARYMHTEFEICAALGFETVIAGYRERLETYLQSRFADSEWQEMVDLGFAACAQFMICIPAFFSVNAETPEDRENFRRELESFTHYMLRAARWL